MKPEEPVVFDVWCGQAALAQATIVRLQHKGYHYDQQAAAKIIIDVPNGFALRTLEELKGRADLQLIVITYSCCPEYWEDLWDLQPLALIVDGTYDHDFAEALHAASHGARYRRTPENRTPLTSTEREVLRYTARGWSNKRIARYLSLQEKTVLNTLSTIYGKLHVGNRTEAALHYWGIHHTFKNKPA